MTRTAEPKKTLLDHCPETDPLMVQSWVDCLRWAISHEPPTPPPQTKELERRMCLALGVR